MHAECVWDACECYLEAELYRISTTAVKYSDMDIYNGDCITSEQGGIHKSPVVWTRAKNCFSQLLSLTHILDTDVRWKILVSFYHVRSPTWFLSTVVLKDTHTPLNINAIVQVI